MAKPLGPEDARERPEASALLGLLSGLCAALLGLYPVSLLTAYLWPFGWPAPGGTALAGFLLGGRALRLDRLAMAGGLGRRATRGMAWAGRVLDMAGVMGLVATYVWVLA